MTLTFDPEKQEYQWDGEVVPRVTKIIEPFLYRGLQFVDPDRLEWARERGKAVHSATELDDADNLDESSLDPLLIPFVEAWREVRRELCIEVVASERQVYHGGRRYAGTLDRLYHRGRRRGVLDIKSSDAPTASLARAVGVQLAAYMDAENYQRQGMENITERMGVLLRGDGTYETRIYDDPRDLVVFQSCLNIYNWSQSQ